MVGVQSISLQPLRSSASQAADSFAKNALCSPAWLEPLRWESASRRGWKPVEEAFHWWTLQGNRFMAYGNLIENAGENRKAAHGDRSNSNSKLESTLISFQFHYNISIILMFPYSQASKHQNLWVLGSTITRLHQTLAATPISLTSYEQQKHCHRNGIFQEEHPKHPFFSSSIISICVLVWVSHGGWSLNISPADLPADPSFGLSRSSRRKRPQLNRVEWGDQERQRCCIQYTVIYTLCTLHSCGSVIINDNSSTEN